MDQKNVHIRSLFDDIAEKYDITNTVMSLGMNRRWRREAAKLASVNHNGRAIDLCCGTGALSFKLANQGYKEIIGIDYSEKMISLAQKKSAGRADVTFIHKDVYENGFPDNHFDAATIAWGLRNTKDCNRTVSEMARLVRPGGKVILLEMGKIRYRFIDNIYWKLFGLIIPLIGYFLTRKFDAYKYFYLSAKNFLTQEEMAKTMEEAGLKNIGRKDFVFGAIAILHGEK